MNTEFVKFGKANASERKGTFLFKGRRKTGFVMPQEKLPREEKEKQKETMKTRLQF